MATLNWKWLPRTRYWKTHDTGVSEGATACLPDGKTLILHSTANGEWFLMLGDKNGKRTKLGSRLGYNSEAEPARLRQLMELRGTDPILTRHEAAQAAERLFGALQI